MAASERGVRRIEAEATMAIGQVQVVRETWDAPIDRTGISGRHHLQLSLLPSSAAASACFPDLWGPHRFEPLGEMFFLPAGHSVRALSDCRHQNAVTCDFEPNAVAAWFGGDLRWTNGRLQGCLDIASAHIRHLLFRIGEEVRAPGFAGAMMVELMMAQLAIELSRHLIGIGESGVTGGLAPWRLRRIDDRLREAGASPTLGELAALCGLSARHLTRAFQISRGRSIGSYIAEQRADHAKRLLASGMSVKAVASAMGCSAPSNFAIAFRRMAGETPSAYRQRVYGGVSGSSHLH